MLSKTVASLQLEETEPEGKSTKICSSFPPRVIALIGSIWQIMSNYSWKKGRS